MTTRIRSVDYEHGGHALGGQLAWDDDWTDPHPCVLVVHDAMKSTQGFEEERAVILAGLGYAAFVVDVYGRDIHCSSNEESYSQMQPFQEDRSFLQKRLLASVSAAASLPEVDGDRLAAIGYCFGGMCVLDLARMNAPVLGVASFHGLLTPPSANDLPGESIRPKVMVLHGWDDPYVRPEMIEPFAKEMSDREADWQLLAFGNTVHSFTNPSYSMPEEGVAYEPQAERRSWRALTGLLEELFPRPIGE
jgi:dienelactone hydrolase